MQASKKRYGFPKSVRLLHRADYRKVYSGGRRRNLDLVVAFALRHESPWSRIGLTVPGSLGDAVERNRVKRRLREVVRKHRSELGPGWDVVLNARPPVKSASFAHLEETIRFFFGSCARSSGSLRPKT